MPYGQFQHYFIVGYAMQNVKLTRAKTSTGPKMCRRGKNQSSMYIPQMRFSEESIFLLQFQFQSQLSKQQVCHFLYQPVSSLWTPGKTRKTPNPEAVYELIHIIIHFLYLNKSYMTSVIKLLLLAWYLNTNYPSLIFRPDPVTNEFFCDWKISGH